MNPEEDPEKRFKELERPLTDVARSAELGTTPFPAAGRVASPATAGVLRPADATTRGAPVLLVGYAGRLDPVRAVDAGLFVGGGAIVAGNLIAGTRTTSTRRRLRASPVAAAVHPVHPAVRPDVHRATFGAFDLGGDRRATPAAR